MSPYNRFDIVYFIPKVQQNNYELHSFDFISDLCHEPSSTFDRGNRQVENDEFNYYSLPKGMQINSFRFKVKAAHDIYLNFAPMVNMSPMRHKDVRSPKIGKETIKDINEEISRMNPVQLVTGFNCFEKHTQFVSTSLFSTGCDLRGGFK